MMYGTIFFKNGGINVAKEVDNRFDACAIFYGGLITNQDVM